MDDWQPVSLEKDNSTGMCVFMLKEIIRFYRKHRTPVYVCYLDASKAFGCVDNWTLFNVVMERKWPALS